MFAVISKYIIGFLAMITIVQGIAIYNYKEDIADMSLKVLVNQVNTSTYKDAIEMQNNAITDIGLIYEEKISLYDEALSNGSMTIYVDRYMEVQDENTSECEAILNILDNVSRIGL